MFQREILFFSEDDRACDSARDLSEGRTEGRGHKKKRRGWEDREMLGDREKSVVAPVVVGGGWWFVELWRWWPDNSGAFSLSLCLSSFSSRVYRRLCRFACISPYERTRLSVRLSLSLSFSLSFSLSPYLYITRWDALAPYTNVLHASVHRTPVSRSAWIRIHYASIQNKQPAVIQRPPFKAPSLFLLSPTVCKPFRSPVAPCSSLATMLLLARASILITNKERAEPRTFRTVFRCSGLAARDSPESLRDWPHYRGLMPRHRGENANAENNGFDIVSPDSVAE